MGATTPLKVPTCVTHPSDYRGHGARQTFIGLQGQGNPIFEPVQDQTHAGCHFGTQPPSCQPAWHTTQPGQANAGSELP
jgi:hypothetical protein